MILQVYGTISLLTARKPLPLSAVFARSLISALRARARCIRSKWRERLRINVIVKTIYKNYGKRICTVDYVIREKIRTKVMSSFFLNNGIMTHNDIDR